MTFLKLIRQVEALIALTNPASPTEHTLTLYSDAETLRGLRRYTLKSARIKAYAPDTNNSSSSKFVIVSNPNKIRETQVGHLCYGGIAGANEASYKVTMAKSIGNRKLSTLFCHEVRLSRY
jgi:hypothetical protein